MTGDVVIKGWLLKWIAALLCFSTYLFYYIASKSFIAVPDEMVYDQTTPETAISEETVETEIPTCVPPIQFPADLNVPLGKEKLEEIYRRQELRMRDSRAEQVELPEGRLSADGKFQYFDRVSIGKSYIELSLMYKTCLATQSSLDRLYPLLEMNDHWDGPLSVAVFVGGNDDYNVFRDYIYLLETCYPRMLDKMMFSLMFPIDSLPINDSYISKHRMAKLTCRDPDPIMEELLKSRLDIIQREFEQHPYPQNHLRNLALHNCIAEYEYIIDVDIVPVKGMANALNSFLSMMENCRKCAFIAPTYEIKEDVPAPETKTELMTLKQEGKARPYHQKVFPESQASTNYTQWEKSHDIYGKNIYVNHHLTGFKFSYEPFYITQASAPHFDENFVGYGYTRSSQAYEAYLAGFRFKVISPVFMLHRGMKEVNDWPEYRIQQNIENSKKFDIFNHDTMYKYKLTGLVNVTIEVVTSEI